MDLNALYNIYLQHPSVQTDSRKIKAGDIFFALKGPNFNGNSYAAQALADGAAFAVIDEPEYAQNEQYIVVENVLLCLQQLARHHRLQLQIPFLAITGSNGKTTTKELITKVLSQKYTTYATEGNLNNHIGVPLTLLKIGSDATMAVIEMGANHQQEIAGYCTIALPDYGLITNCGKAHLEGFGGTEGVKKAKGELYDHVRAHKGTIFRFSDADYLQQMASGIAHQITYGTANAQILGRAIKDGVFLTVAILTAGLECTIHTQLVGDYNLPNVLAAVAVGHHFGVPIEKIKSAIEAYAPSNRIIPSF
jgi:UDP-N-acetylmuramoyl-tripeptide--D-alanyl-D-alanine ligase